MFRSLSLRTYERIVIAAACITVAACAGGAPPGAKRATDARIETRLFTFETCPATGVQAEVVPGQIAPLLAPIVSALISSVVGSVVDRGTEAIKAAAKDRDIVVPGPAAVQRMFYEIGTAGDVRVNPDVACIALVRGSFVTDAQAAGTVSSSAPIIDRILARFRVVPPGADPSSPEMTYTRLLNKPDFYFETALIVAPDRKSFAFRPQAVFAGDFVSEDGLFGSDHRNYKVTLTFTDSFASQPFASADFTFEGLRRNDAVVDCDGAAQNTYCSADALGGIRGWHPTRPDSDDTTALVRQRQKTAATLATAVTPWRAPTAPVSPLDEGMTASAQAAYCQELQKAGKEAKANDGPLGVMCPPR